MATVRRNESEILECLLFWGRFEPTLLLLAAANGWCWPEVAGWFIPVHDFKFELGLIVAVLLFAGLHYAPLIRTKFEVAQRFPNRSCSHRLCLLERLLKRQMRKRNRLPRQIDLDTLR